MGEGSSPSAALGWTLAARRTSGSWWENIPAKCEPLFCPQTLAVLCLYCVCTGSGYCVLSVLCLCTVCVLWLCTGCVPYCVCALCLYCVCVCVLCLCV